MIVLGLDAATTTGWAVVEGGNGKERLVRAGALRVDPIKVEAFAVELAPLVDLVAIETPWLGKNPATMKALAGIAAVWEHVFRARGREVEQITASAWQSHLLRGLINGVSKREQRKRAALIWVRATFGVTLGEDACDAVGIAVWAARKAARPQLEQTALAFPRQSPGRRTQRPRA